MSDDKILRVHDAKILYSNVRDKIRTTNQKLTTKIDDASVEDGYLVLKSDGVEVKRLTGFGGSGGSGGGSIANNAVLTVTNMSGWTEKVFAQDNTINISIYWTSLENGNSTGAGTATLYVNNTAKISGTTIAQGLYSPDISSYLSLGVNSIRLIITDSYGNSSQQNYTITLASYKITANNFSTSTAYSDDIPFVYTITGDGDKYVHFIVDGVDLTADSPEIITSKSTVKTYVIPKQPHGTHSLEVYFTVELNGNTIESNRLSYSLICTGDSDDPVISVSVDKTNAKQYDTITLSYQVYDVLNTDNTTVVICTSDGGDFVEGTTLTNINSNSIYKWTYKINNGNPNGSTDNYNLVFRVKCRNVIAEVTVVVTPLQKNIEALSSNLTVYFTSAGRSNNESSDTLGVWKSNSSDIYAELSGFNWNSNGWINDSSTNNYPALRISNGARVVLPITPFKDNDIINSGATFEFEFSTRNVNSYEDVLIDCFDDTSNTGLQITAQKASLYSSGKTLYTQYKEEEHIRVSFVIEPKKSDTSSLMFIYINGIISGIIEHEGKFTQNVGHLKNIVIGSDNTIIDLYNIRIYNIGLTRNQIVNNWIADMQDSDSMIEYYDKNNIFFDDAAIVPEINPEALDDELPYMILDVANAMDDDENPILDSDGNPAGYLPQYKGDKKKINGIFVDKAHPERSFKFKKADINVQGTSSQWYPRKNYKIKFKGFIPSTTSSYEYFDSFDSKKSYYKLYRMRGLNSVGAKAFTFKADFASSEGANNVELVRYYNDLCPYKTPPQQEDSKIRQGIDGFPIAMFGQNADGSTFFIGKYNFNDDKGSTDVYGLSSHGEEIDEDNNYKLLHKGVPDESWETGDNSNLHTRWITYPENDKTEIINTWLGNPTLTNSEDLDGIYEIRYPDLWQDSLAKKDMYSLVNPTRFYNLHKWVTSTDTHSYSQSYNHGIKKNYVKISEYKPESERPIINVGKTDVSSLYERTDDEPIVTITYKSASGVAEDNVQYYDCVYNITDDTIINDITEVSIYYLLIEEKDSNNNVINSYYEKASGKAEEGKTYYERNYVEYTGDLIVGESDVSNLFIVDTRTEEYSYKKSSGVAKYGVDYYILTGEELEEPQLFETLYELVDPTTISIDEAHPNDPEYNTVVTGWYTYDSSTDTYTRINSSENEQGEAFAQEGVTYYTLNSKTYYYDDKEYRLAKFKAEFENYFDLQDSIFYYLFTEAFLMIDSRVKNSFPTYYALVNKTVSPTPIYEETSDSVAKADTKYFYKQPVYALVDTSSIILTGDDVSDYFVESSEENPPYRHCESGTTAEIGTVYYTYNSETSTYAIVDTITYPTDITKLYIKTSEENNTYEKAAFPVDLSINYYSMSESGPMTEDTTISEGSALSEHTYFIAKDDYIYTDTGEGRWCWLPYDMDTALGINNEGILVYNYNLEDNDIIDGSGNIIEKGSIETTEIDTTKSVGNVFNGQDAVIWNNLRECFSSDIASQYSTLRTGAFNYATIESRFEAHQNAWPAKLWNEDAYFKYIKPLIDPDIDPETGKVKKSENYLGMCLGPKDQQRKWWLYNRFKYLDSKYTTGDSISKFIYFRSYNLGKGIIDIIPYTDIYVRFRMGKDINAFIRGYQDKVTTIDLASINRGYSPNDTETYIYSADQIKEVRGLSELEIDSLNLSFATRLLHLNLDGLHSKWDPNTNTYSTIKENGKLKRVDLKNNTMLQTLSMKNCSGIDTTISLLNCKYLTDVNLLGCTKLTGVDFASGGKLKNVYIPSEKVTQLMLKDQLYLTNLHMMKLVQDDNAEDVATYEELSSNDDTKNNVYYDESTGFKYIEDYSNLQYFYWNNVNNTISDKMFDILFAIPSTCRIGLYGFSITLNTEEKLNEFISHVQNKERGYCFYSEENNSLYTSDNNPIVNGTVSADWSEGSTPLTLTYEDVKSIQNDSVYENGQTKYGLKNLTFDYPIRKTVKFYNGETLLNTQTVTTKGFTGGSVTYSGEMPTKADIEPLYDSVTKTWTTGTHYVFAGWSTSPNSTTAKWKFNDTDNWRDLDEITDPTQTLDGITASISVYAIFLEVPYFGVEVYDYRGTTSIGTYTVKESDYIVLSDQDSETLDSQTVDFAGWGTQAYGGEDLSYEKLEGSQRIYIDQNRVIYAIMNWPISSIEVTTPPTKTNYYIGEVFDPTGVVVKAEKKIINSNGEEEVTEPLIVSTYDYSPKTALTADTRIITFSLDGKYYHQNIGIAQSISVSDDGIEKSLFNVGESWDPTGLKITVTYRVGNAGSSTEEISIDSKNKADSLFTVSLNGVFVKPSELGFTESGKHLLTIKMIKQDLRSTVHASVLPNIKSVLEENSWKDIDFWAENGYGASTWNIGDEKSITIPEGDYQYITSGTVNFRILGFDHNTEIETNGEHTITFGLSTKSISGTNIDFVYPSIEAINRDEFKSHTAAGASVFSWHFGSALNDACIEFYNALPSEVKGVIRSTTKSQADAEENMVELCYNCLFNKYAEGEGDNRDVYKDNVTVWLGSDIVQSKKLELGRDKDGNIVNCPVFVPNMMEIFGYNKLVSDLGEVSWDRKFTADESVSSKQFSYYQDYKDTSGNVVQVNNFVTAGDGPINYIAYKYKNSSSGPTLTSYWTRSILGYRYQMNNHVSSMYGTFCPVGSVNNNTRFYANMEYYSDGSILNSRTLKGFLPCFVI